MKEKLYEMTPGRQKVTFGMFASMWKHATIAGEYGLMNCIDFEKEIEKLQLDLLDELVDTGEDVYNSDMANDYIKPFWVSKAIALK